MQVTTNDLATAATELQRLTTTVGLASADLLGLMHRHGALLDGFAPPLGQSVGGGAVALQRLTDDWAELQRALAALRDVYARLEAAPPTHDTRVRPA